MKNCAQEQQELEVVKLASPVSSDTPACKVEINSASDTKMIDGISSEKLDEMDAAEAAQFKADVQGHRQHEVGRLLRE